jgi:crossover junction endodeoxyribonuclease RuvC
MSIIMGVDPGVSGAVAFFYTQAPERIWVDDVPVAGGEIEPTLLADMIAKAGLPKRAFVERVSAMPKQGVTSSFNFGRSYGCVIGVIGAMKIPLELVSPTVWKKALNLSADKEQCRLRAIRLFPAVADKFARKKDDGRAEAALIALYGAQVLNKQAA